MQRLRVRSVRIEPLRRRGVAPLVTVLFASRSALHATPKSPSASYRPSLNGRGASSRISDKRLAAHVWAIEDIVALVAETREPARVGGSAPAAGGRLPTNGRRRGTCARRSAVHSSGRGAETQDEEAQVIPGDRCERTWRVPMTATITCPMCRAVFVETIPTDACRYFYSCRACRALPRPKQVTAACFARIRTGRVRSDGKPASHDGWRAADGKDRGHVRDGSPRAG